MAVIAKIQGYKSVLDNPDPGDVCTASLASLEGLVSSSSSGSLTLHLQETGQQLHQDEIGNLLYMMINSMFTQTNECC